MSFTISASAGDDKVCKATNRALLPSCAPSSMFRRSTNSAPSSAQRVIPGSYSDSQVGQNIVEIVAQDIILRDVPQVTVMPNLKFSAPPLRPLRLGGEGFAAHYSPQRRRGRRDRAEKN